MRFFNIPSTCHSKSLISLIVSFALSGCQLTLPEWFQKEQPKPETTQPQVKESSKAEETTITTAIAPIIPDLSEEFLLQPEVSYVPPPRRVPQRSNRTTAEVQLFEHVIAFSLPKKWQQTDMKARSGYRRFKYAPSYTSVLGQDEISIEAFQNYNNHYSAQQLIDSYVKRAKARCHHVALYESLGKSELNGFPIAEAIYGCAANTQAPSLKSEVSYVMAIEAGGNMYLLNKSLKTRPFPLSKTPLTSNSVQRFLDPIQPIQLCLEKEASRGCDS